MAVTWGTPRPSTPREVQAGDPDQLLNTVTATFDTQADLNGTELTDDASDAVDLLHQLESVRTTAPCRS